MNSSQSQRPMVILVIGIIIGAVLALAVMWVYRTNIRPQELQNAITTPAFPKALPKLKFLQKVQVQGLQNGNLQGTVNPITPSLPSFNPVAEGDPMPGRTN